MVPLMHATPRKIARHPERLLRHASACEIWNWNMTQICAGIGTEIVNDGYKSIATSTQVCLRIREQANSKQYTNTNAYPRGHVTVQVYLDLMDV